jgi:DedD protein
MNTARLLMDRRVKERLIGATILVVLMVLIVPELLSGPKPAALPPLAADLPSSTRHVSVNLATSNATSQPQPPDTAAESAAPETPGTAGARAVGSSSSAGGAGAAPQAADTEGSARGVSGAGAHANEGAPGSSPAAASGPKSGPTVATLKAQESAVPLETANSSSRSPLEGASDAEGAHSHRGWAVQLGSFASKANAEKLLHQVPGSGLYLISSGSGASLRYRVRMGPLADRGAAERAVTRLKAQGHAATIVTPAS